MSEGLIVEQWRDQYRREQFRVRLFFMAYFMAYGSFVGGVTLWLVMT